MKYHTLLDLPKIDYPEPSESQLGEVIFDNQGDDRGYLRNEWLRRTGAIGQHGQRHSLARYQRYRLGTDILEYLLAMMPELRPHVRDWGYQKIYNQDADPMGAMMLTHTDGERRGKHCIQALWNTGGQGVKTSWWQEKGHGIERPTPMICTTSHKDMTLLEEVEFEAGSWAIFRTDLLHSVQPIQTKRTSFSVGFTNNDLYQFLIEKYAVKS